MAESQPLVKVLFSCSGIGIFNRGIETYFREAFDALKGTEGLDSYLLKSAGENTSEEARIWCLPRTGLLAASLGRLIRRNAYVAEQLSSFPAVVRRIRRLRPDVVFYSDANLGFQLLRWRQQIGVPYRLLFSNGGPCHPPFLRTDFVHQVAPAYHDEALQAGEPPEKRFMVPYGISVPSVAPNFDAANKRALRARLGLPRDYPVVLSVGWIARQHKRMDYVIEEVARLPKPRPFLQLLGALDESSSAIIAMGRRLLGAEGFSVASVPPEQVSDYYRAADCFVLASLQEGFGRVYLEALMHGLPVIAHRHPVMEFVIGNEGILGDLTQPGELSGLIAHQLARPLESEVMRQRWQSVRERFDWPKLAPQYAAMFRACAVLPNPGQFSK